MYACVYVCGDFVQMYLCYWSTHNSASKRCVWVFVGNRKKEKKKNKITEEFSPAQFVVRAHSEWNDVVFVCVSSANEQTNNNNQN